MTVNDFKIKTTACRYYLQTFFPDGFPILAAIAAVAGLLCGEVALGRVVDLGVSQEFGYEQRLRTEERSGDDFYTKTSVSIAPGHPFAFRDGKLILDPSLRLSYINYFRFDSLDTFAYELHGPLRYEFPRGGRRPDSLEIIGNLSRELVTVSTRTGTRASRSIRELGTLYTRHLRYERWRVEAGYDYTGFSYDDEEYDSLERDEHGFSLAMLYALSRKLDVGLGGSYEIANFTKKTEDDTRTTEIRSLARWQLTGRMEAGIEIGHETVAYRNFRGEESGMTVRGRLDWRPTPRLRSLADLRHEFDVAGGRDELGDERSQVSTTRASLRLSRNFTRRLMGAITPAMKREGGDRRVVEYLLDLSMGYSFPLFDLTVQTGVTERRSDAGDDDEYTAARALVRFDIDF